MSNELERRVIAISVVPQGQPLYSEMCTDVRIVDEAAGEFVEVEQHGAVGVGKICINPSEWPTLRDIIDQMIADCRDHE